MEKHERECTGCHQIFHVAEMYGSRCKKCMREANKISYYKWKDKKKAEAEKKRKLGTIDEVTLKARDLGLTYGQYMARQFMKEQKECKDK